MIRRLAYGNPASVAYSNLVVNPVGNPASTMSIPVSTYNTANCIVNTYASSTVLAPVPMDKVKDAPIPIPY